MSPQMRRPWSIYVEGDALISDRDVPSPDFSPSLNSDELEGEMVAKRQRVSRSQWGLALRQGVRTGEEAACSPLASAPSRGFQ